jgi:DNA-binding response OmpR family regulator
VKVLIVEDEFKTATYLRKGLSEHGYVADVASKGEDGLYLAQNSEYDLLILDVMLPSRDGWSVMSELRRSGKLPRQALGVFLNCSHASERSFAAGGSAGANPCVSGVHPPAGPLGQAPVGCGARK